MKSRVKISVLLITLLIWSVQLPVYAGAGAQTELKAIKEKVLHSFATDLKPIFEAVEKITAHPEGKKIIEEMRKKREREEKELARKAERAGKSYAGSYSGGRSYGSGDYGSSRYGGRRGYRGNGYGGGGYGGGGYGGSRYGKRYGGVREGATSSSTGKTGPRRTMAVGSERKKKPVSTKKDKDTSYSVTQKGRRTLQQVMADLIRDSKDFVELMKPEGDRQKAIYDAFDKVYLSSLREIVSDLIRAKVKPEALHKNEQVQQALVNFIEPLLVVIKHDLEPAKQAEELRVKTLKEQDKQVPAPKHKFELFDEEQRAGLQALQWMLAHSMVENPLIKIGNLLAKQEAQTFDNVKKSFEMCEQQVTNDTLLDLLTASQELFKSPHAYEYKKQFYDADRSKINYVKHINALEALAKKINTFIKKQSTIHQERQEVLSKLNEKIKAADTDNLSSEQVAELDELAEQLKEKVDTKLGNKLTILKGLSNRNDWEVGIQEVNTQLSEQSAALTKLTPLWGFGAPSEPPSDEG